MATDPAEKLRALRRQLAVTAALGHTLGHATDLEVVKAEQVHDDVDEQLDPSPKRMTLELTRDDDGRSL
ncbi:MAG: hypothetical protein J2P24_05780 [Streptosporangiales bacterium]|nr:hypothetical protein [Streptosporangiales bacterium]MBO0891033.1 hypothetical protein [Acidothermales bacterium]